MKKTLTQNTPARHTCLRFTLPMRLISSLTLFGLLAGLGLLASRPAHTAGGPVSVNVANAPLPVTNSLGQPVEVTITTAGTSSSSIGNLVYTVPAHKNLVVESMTLFGGGGHSNSYIGMVHNEDSTGNTLSYATLATPSSTNSDVAATTQPMHFTVASGGNVSIDVYLRDTGGVFSYVSLSGHLVNAP